MFYNLLFVHLEEKLPLLLLTSIPLSKSLKKMEYIFCFWTEQSEKNRLEKSLQPRIYEKA